MSSNRLDQPLTVLPADPPRRTLRWILSCAIVVALVMVLLGAGLGMWLRLGNLDNSRGEQGGSVSEGGPASAGDSWIQRARSQHQRGDYAKALDDWDRAVHAAQGNDALTVEGLVGRADTSLAKQDYESAIRDCTQALRLNPQAPHAAALRGIAYLRLKRFDEALAELNRAIDLDPNDARALRERDRVYFERTDYLLTYLPSGCQLIVSARPDQLMKSEVFQELRREIPEFEKVYQSDFDKQQGWLASSDIDQAVFGLSSADLATFVGVSHTKKSITAHDLRARIANVTYTETRVGKYVIHERQDANHQAFCVVDPQCVIVGTKDALSAVLQRDNKPEFSKNLWKALDQVDFSKSVVLAWEISPGLLQGEGDQALLGTNKDLANALKQINSVALQAAVGSDVRIELALFYPAAAAANEGKMGIEAILAQEGNNPALPKEIVALLRLNFQVEGKKVIGRNTIKVGPLIKLFKSKS